MFAESSFLYQVLYETAFKHPCHYRGFFGHKDFELPAIQHLENVLMVQRQEGRLARMGLEAQSWIVREAEPVIQIEEFSAFVFYNLFQVHVM